jgi:hypothetical protein
MDFEIDHVYGVSTGKNGFQLRQLVIVKPTLHISALPRSAAIFILSRIHTSVPQKRSVCFRLRYGATRTDYLHCAKVAYVHSTFHCQVLTMVYDGECTNPSCRVAWATDSCEGVPHICVSPTYNFISTILVPRILRRLLDFGKLV